jgi:hypothetical protein
VRQDDDGHVELTRKALVGFLQQQAEWRVWKAEEHPEDPRHARSADGLVTLASYVEGLGAADERLRRLAMVHGDDLDVLVPGEDAAQLAGRYCFEGDERPDPWLAMFVDAVVTESLRGADDEQDWL